MTFQSITDTFALRKNQITEAKRIEVINFDSTGVFGVVYTTPEEAIATVAGEGAKETDCVG